MRFAHARPATVTLVAGSVLITATSGFSLAAVMGGTPAWAHPSGYAIAADDAVTATGDQSCEPFKLPAPPQIWCAAAIPTKKDRIVLILSSLSGAPLIVRALQVQMLPLKRCERLSRNRCRKVFDGIASGRL